ncbi:MAG: threonine synthase, partial [Bacteroidota bacterium]
EIREIIGRVFKESGYLCDPHGATGYQAARTYLDEHPGHTGIFLETAHPAKFKESVEPVTGKPVEIPGRLAAFAKRKKESTLIKPGYQEFREYLTSTL